MIARSMRKYSALATFSVWLAVIGAVSYAQARAQQPPGSGGVGASAASQRVLLDRYCVTCHNEKRLTAGTIPVAFEKLHTENVGADAEIWEKVVGRMRLDMMPPAGSPRPDEATYKGFVAWLETELDRAAAVNPNPGRPAVRRMTGSEYINAIRDLLGVDLDAQALMFPDDETDEKGFTTNGDVLSVSTALLERYLAAARRVSRLAVGDPMVGPEFASRTYSTPQMLNQDERPSEDLPFGSRGGLAIRYYFPLDGDYEVKISLTRMIYNYVIGMERPQRLDVLLDGALVKSFTVGDADRFGYPSAYTFFTVIRGDPGWEQYMTDGADADLRVRFPAKAGMHVVGVTFVNDRSEPTGIQQRRLAGFSRTGEAYYHGNAGVDDVEISGPYNAAGPGDTPSRKRIFTCRPARADDEDRCARQILSALARRAYRQPVSEDDLKPLLAFYKTGRSGRGFEGGIQKALERLLVAPEFLFRVEREPANVRPGTAYRLNDFELASRLSFFLWSGIPDDELLAAAEKGRLRDPAVLAQQVRRMLADARSAALVDNFAGQWLQLGRIRGATPDPDLFFEFDDSLRADMERETTLFLESQIREDRSLIDLLTANYTLLNERLARHYGIPNVYGERFRRVTLADNDDRRGLLGHASLLTVTAYPTRTSPVVRGKWVLDTFIGMPPPPPPANVPALEENRGGAEVLTIRKRMEQHRANPTCAACHRMMDPIGFAFENFDAVGRSRATDETGAPVDTSGVLSDGTSVKNLTTLRDALLTHKESYVRTVTQKLLTYALGRDIEHYDQPAIRKISAAAAPDHRWSSVVLGIVESVPFQMRRAGS